MKRSETANQQTTSIFNFLGMIKNKNKEEEKQDPSVIKEAVVAENKTDENSAKDTHLNSEVQIETEKSKEIEKKLTITTDVNADTHNEPVSPKHTKNSKPIITIADLKKATPQNTNEKDNQNSDNLPLNTNKDFRMNSDSVNLNKTNPTSKNAKTDYDSTNDKKKDSNLYKASKFQIIRNKSKTPSVQPPSKFIESSSKSNFQLFSPVKKMQKEQPKKMEKTGAKTTTKIKIINKNVNASGSKSRNIQHSLANNKSSSPERKMFKTENRSKVGKSSQMNAKVNYTSHNNTNKSKIIRFTKRRQENKQLGSVDTTDKGLRSSSVNELRNIKQLNSKLDDNAINKKLNVLKSHKLPTFPNKLTKTEPEETPMNKKTLSKTKSTLDDKIISEIERKLTLMDRLISE